MIQDHILKLFFGENKKIKTSDDYFFFEVLVVFLAAAFFFAAIFDRLF